MVNSKEISKLIETISMKAQTLDLHDKDFNSIILNIQYAQRVEGNHGQRTKVRKPMCEQNENINK